MNTPENILYAKSHEWIRVEGEEAVVGITDFAQHALGDITFVDLPAVGDSFDQGQDMGAVESVKAASDIYMPVACEVIAINEALDDNPALVNSDPYGEGWLIRVKVTGEVEGLMDAAAYAASTAE